MSVLAVFCTLVATFAIALCQLYRKYLLSRRILTEWDLLVGQCMIGTLCCAAVYLIIGTQWNELAPHTHDARVWWIALAVTTLANIIIQFANMRATRLAEVSFTSPLSALTPGLVVACALAIGEMPSMWGKIGIVIIVVGTYMHVREGVAWREYFVPLFVWLVFRNTQGLLASERNKIRALRWAYAGALFSTAGLLGDGLVARHGDMLLAVTLELATLTLAYTALVRPVSRDEGDFASTHERFRQHGGHVVVLGVLFSVPFICLGVAFRLAPIADIGSLKRLAIVITVIGGALLLGEKSGLRRMLLASAIVAGAILIAFDPAPAVVLDSLDAYLRSGK